MHKSRVNWLFLALFVLFGAELRAQSRAMELINNAPIYRTNLLVEFPEDAEETDPLDTYNRHFGKLSEPDFRALQNYFGARNMQYDGRRKYTLLDFLPVKMRALHGNVLEGVKVKAKEIVEDPYHNRGRPEAPLTSFCLGSAYEMNRPGDRFDAFFWDKYYLLSVLNDPQYAQRVSQEEAEFGDIVAYFVVSTLRNRPSSHLPELLLHTANVLDKDLQFEKADIYPHLPWRINKRINSIAELSQDIASRAKTQSRGRLEIRYFRTKGAARPFPSIFELVKRQGIEFVKPGILWGGANDAQFGGIEGGWHAVRSASIQESRVGQITIQADPDFKLRSILGNKTLSDTMGMKAGCRIRLGDSVK